MTSETQYRFVGGPMDGRMIATESSLVCVCEPDHEGPAYHRTHRLVNEQETDLERWWMRGLPEPQWETIYEWHDREWVSPAVQAIRDAVGEATERVIRNRA